MEGSMTHCWCQWKEKGPTIGVNGKNDASFLESVKGIMPPINYEEIMPQGLDKGRQRAAVWTPC